MNSHKKKVFIGGSRRLTRLNDDVIDHLDRIIESRLPNTNRRRQRRGQSRAKLLVRAQLSQCNRVPFRQEMAQQCRKLGYRAGRAAHNEERLQFLRRERQANGGRGKLRTHHLGRQEQGNAASNSASAKSRQESSRVCRELEALPEPFRIGRTITRKSRKQT